jgi:hypothetical protein
VITLEDLSIPAPEVSRLDWNDDGVVVMPKLLDDDLIEDYEDEWIRENGFPGDDWWTHANRGGWAYATPYMHHPALRRISTFAGIHDVLEDLIGEPAGLHLNLTGWVSTERDWHQDTYLNPSHVGPYYVAVWMALDDVKPDSGPFQFVAGSHRWMEVTRERMEPHLDIRDPLWPKHSERLLTPLFEQEIERRDAPVVDYLPRRGDVLFWHSRLLHRGSRPTNPDAQRRALIAHYSGINHRQDMPPARRTGHGGWFFPIAGAQPTR